MFRLYEAALREYHFNVNLGSERQKFYVGLNVAYFGALAGISSKISPVEPLLPTVFLAGAFLVGAMTSVLGAFGVVKAHEYYRNARDQFQRIERMLQLDRYQLSMTTTPGMQGKASGLRLKIVDMAKLTLLLLAALNLAAAAWTSLALT
jgi:hypothetical protein